MTNRHEEEEEELDNQPGIASKDECMYAQVRISPPSSISVTSASHKPMGSEDCHVTCLVSAGPVSPSIYTGAPVHFG